MPTKIFIKSDVDSLEFNLIQNHHNNDYKSNKNNSKNSFKVIKESFRKFVFHILSKRLKPINQELIDYSKVKNILIIRNDGLGDYVVTTPLINTLKKINPSVQIDIISSPRNDLLIKNDNFIRRTFLIHHKPSYKELRKVAKDIRNSMIEFDYDVIFAPKHTSTTKNAYLSSKISHNAKKITFSHSDKIRNSAYNLVFSNLIDIESEYKVWAKNFYNFPIEKKFNLKVTDKKISLKNLFNLKSENSNKILINISAFEKDRFWNTQSIIESIEKILNEKSNEQIIFVTGSPDDFNRVDDIVKHIKSGEAKNISEKIFALKFDFQTYLQIFDEFDLVITPDTAVVHFADALKIPVIILFNSVDKLLKWRPMHSEFVALLPEHSNNINEIDTEQIKKAKEILGF